MPSKKLAALAATALGAALVVGALAGCTSSPANSNTSTPSNSNTASSSTTTTQVKLEDQIVGTWKLAAAESEGLTMSGDLSTMMGIDISSTLTLAADGTGTLKLGDESTDLKWVAATDSFTVTATDEKGTENEMQGTYDEENGAVILEYTDESDTSATNESSTGTESVSLIFTDDGTYAAAKEISMDKATPVKSKDEIEGTWRLSGLSIMGISAYGDPDALAALSGGETAAATVTFTADGKAKIGEEEGTWEVTADGATLTTAGMTGGTSTSNIKLLGDDLVMDAGGADTGSTATDAGNENAEDELAQMESFLSALNIVLLYSK